MIKIKIVTINVPESYIEAMNRLIGEDGIYPSRSELVRVAVREFLIKIFRDIKQKDNINNDVIKLKDMEELEDPNIIKIAIKKENKVIGFKQYKVIQKLE